MTPQPDHTQPPAIVYARRRRGRHAHWWYAVERPRGVTLFCRFGFDYWVTPKFLTVVPHVRNDAAAVGVIEGAKRCK